MLRRTDALQVVGFENDPASSSAGQPMATAQVTVSTGTTLKSFQVSVKVPHAWRRPGQFDAVSYSGHEIKFGTRERAVKGLHRLIERLRVQSHFA